MPIGTRVRLASGGPIMLIVEMDGYNAVCVAPEIAAFRKRMFDEHVKAGFTAEQALVLCQKITV